MKILHIISNGNIGGREKMLYLLINKESQDKNLETSAFFYKPVGPYFLKIKELGIPVYSTNTHSTKNMRDMILLMEKFDAIVFHFVNWKLFLFGILSGRTLIYRLSGIYLLNKKKIKDVFRIVMSKIYLSDSNPNASLSQVKRNGEVLPSSQTSGNLPNYRSFLRTIKRYYFSFFLKKSCHCLIANSKYTAKNAVTRYGIQPNKIRIVFNGIEFNYAEHKGDFFRSKYNIPKDAFVIGTVCRFDVRKRLDRLFAGFSMVKEANNIRLVITGGGDEGLESKFKQFAMSNNFIDRVVFTGIIENPTPAIDAMDLFVLPSDNETFGISLVEAMYRKKPVVVFADSGGPVEIIYGRDCGYIINTPSELPAIIHNLNQHPELALQLGNNSQKVAVETYNIDRFYRDSVKVYKEAIAI